MNLSIIISALKQRFWWIIVIPMACATALFFLTKQTPKKYKSYAQIATGITESAEVSINDSRENDQPYKIAQKFNNLMELLRSRQTINLLQYQILIHELTSATPFLHPEDVDKYIHKGNKQKLINLIKIRLDSMLTLNFMKKDDVEVQNLINFYGIGIDGLTKNITIKRLPDSDYLSVEVETENPDYSAFIANTLIQEFIRFYQAQKASKSAGSVGFFEKMARIKKRELDAKVNELKNYKLKNNVINLYEQTKSIVNQLSSVEIMREQENAKIPSLDKAIKDIELRFTSKDKLFYANAGALSYLSKNVGSNELINAISTVYKGNKYFSPHIMELFALGLAEERKRKKEAIKLSRREKEILECLAKGLSTKQMADKSFLSARTVESHRLRLLKKFSAQNAMELVKIIGDKKLLQ